MKRLGFGRRERGRDEPHQLASALEAVRAEVAPQTLLASVQETWPQVAGATVAAQADPPLPQDIVVTGEHVRGSAIGAIEPVAVLDRAAIAAIGGP